MKVALELSEDQARLLRRALENCYAFHQSAAVMADATARRFLVERKPDEAARNERRQAEFLRRADLVQGMLDQLPDAGVLDAPMGKA